MVQAGKSQHRLSDGYSFPGFRAGSVIRGVFGDRDVRIITLTRRSKKPLAVAVDEYGWGWYDRTTRRVRDLSSAGYRIVLELEVRRVACPVCGVKRERLDFLADNPHFTKRFAFYVGRRCRQASIRDVAKELRLTWDTVNALEMHYMRAQIERAGTPAPRAIGVDEIAVRKGHNYRIVVSDLVQKRPVWFGGDDRSEASMAQFYDWLGPEKSSKLRLIVMDMWKPFRSVARGKAPQAAILFDKFHIMRHLGEALDKVRKAEYARLTGKDRRFIKGQKYTLLSHRDNLSLDGKRSLTLLLAANKRLNTAYVLKEAFGQLWDYRREGWARRFFDNWRASLSGNGSAGPTSASMRWSSPAAGIRRILTASTCRTRRLSPACVMARNWELGRAAC
jgi:transposase